jgi:hypothetical protein
MSDTTPITATAQPVDSTFLLAPPVRFHLPSGEDHIVVSSAYLPARYGTLPEHVVIYYTGRTHWSQVGIPGDETAFGVGRVQYDDDDQKTRYEPVSAQQTYAQAIATYAAHLAAASDVELDKARADMPEGTPVTYWPGYNQHVGRETVTRSEVWRMPAGQLVVKLDGYTGGIALTHITKRHRATGQR